MAPAVLNRTPLWRRIPGLFHDFDWWLVLAILLLCAVGMVTMYSAGFDHGLRFGLHGRHMLLAAGVIFVVAQLTPRQLMQLAVPLYVAGVTLLVAVALFGITKKGAQRWISVGVVIQPSEILKIAAPLMLAWWFQLRQGSLRAPDYVVAFALLALPVALIMKQPDLGTALLVLISGLAVIYFAGLSWKLILPPFLLFMAGVAFLLWNEQSLCAEGVRWSLLHDYQQQRICTLLDPGKDPLGKGFHTIQGMIAIGSGGVWGKGFLQGTQTHLEFIPERTTDFVFAAYSEEFGLAGNLVLLACFAFLILRALVIALRAPTFFGQLVAAAVAVSIFAYVFVNMGMVSGILPVVGVPLPFISYGGTAMVSMGLSLGVLMSVARSGNRARRRRKDEFSML